MALWKASTTKSEWSPDDPTAFAPTKPWKLPFFTTWGGSPNRNLPTNSAEEAKNGVDRFSGACRAMFFIGEGRRVPGRQELARQYHDHGERVREYVGRHLLRYLAVRPHVQNQLSARHIQREHPRL